MVDKNPHGEGNDPNADEQQQPGTTGGEGVTEPGEGTQTLMDVTEPTRLFPDYLDSETQGAEAATALLQTMLILAKHNEEELQIDGVYGPLTEASVRTLQATLGVDTDGKFGPDTRDAFLESFGLDVNQIPAGPFIGHA